MLYLVKVAVCSEIKHKKPTYDVGGKYNFMLNLLVHQVIGRL